MERVAEIVKWIKYQLHAASDKKTVSYIGLTVAAFSAACIQIGPEWIHDHAPALTTICKIAGALGTFLVALGKGIGDRREVRPDADAPEAIRSEGE